MIALAHLLGGTENRRAPCGSTLEEGGALQTSSTPATAAAAPAAVTPSSPLFSL